MSRWTNDDFAAAADSIAKAFFVGQNNGGASLNELATKCARDNSLNPEQIGRLCRLVNTRAFETKLAEMQGDKYVQFPVADADVVSSELAGAASLKTASADGGYPELPDGLASLRETPEPEGMKLASEYADARRVCDAIKSEPADVVHRRAKHAAERHAGLAEQAEAEWATAMRAVVEKTAGIRWDHDAFEKSALVHTGGACLFELNEIRSILGMEPLDVPAEKMAALLDRIEATETPGARLMMTAAKARLKCAEHLAKAEEAGAERDRRWAETLEGLKRA